MKKLFYLFFIGIAFINVQCRPTNGPDIEPIGTLKIHFIPTYEGLPLYMDKEVKHNNLPLKFQRLSLFTDLVTGTANSSVQKIDFSGIYDEKAAKEGVTITFNDFLIGTYDNAQLSIGVNRIGNKKIPSDYKNSEPLSEVADYWDSWKSYIFTKTEGKVDKNGTGKFDYAFSYHTGTDEMYRTFTLPKSFSIAQYQTTDITVEIDFKKVLNGANGLIDPLKDQNAHSLANKPVALKIMDNYKTAFSLK